METGQESLGHQCQILARIFYYFDPGKLWAQIYVNVMLTSLQL